MKHAYLIIAHNEFLVLERLLQCLDDERNDIYLHLDKKVKKCPTFITKYAGLYVLPKRIDVRWGDVSMVEVEFLLFETAANHGDYSYYHLLSGVDMPLKSQDYIHQFFQKNKGKEFIGYYKGENGEADIERKIRLWHLFPKNLLSGGIKEMLRENLIRFQLSIGIRRNRNVSFKKGYQWVSVSNAFVSFFLSYKKEILCLYSHTSCSDEVFLQTICWNSPFQKQLYDVDDEGRGALRMIRWIDDRIVGWTENDLEMLIKSEALFARKFSEKNLGVVDRLQKYLKK